VADISYLDFDLEIERNGQSYRARVASSPAGEAFVDFTMPLSPLEIENFQLRISRPRGSVRRVDTQEMASAKEFGGRLFNAVFAGEIQGLLRSSMDEARRQDRTGLRLRLRLNGVPELATLPWEYLYNSGRNQFLALSNKTPLVRYMELPEAVRPLKVTPPVRVLAMISSPHDFPTLDVNREWEKLHTALGDLESRGLIALERLDDATLPVLQRRIRRDEFHIFHFVGHGGFDKEAQDGFLLFKDEEGRGRRVSSQYLGTVLHDEGTLRLAVLNACEGARSSNDDPFAGTAQGLVQQGIPAVIAMQFEVSDSAAIAFTAEFYAALADGYPVDAALADGRRAIFAQGNEVEWGTPVLYMRSPDGRLFDLAPHAPARLVAPAHPPTTAPAVAPTAAPAVPSQPVFEGRVASAVTAPLKPPAPLAAETADTVPISVPITNISATAPAASASSAASSDLVLAGFGARAWAYLIDVAVVFGLLVLVELVIADAVVEWGVASAYWVILWSRSGGGQTVGMRILKIKVMGTNGQPVTLGAAILRYIGFMAGSFAFGIGLLWAAWDAKRQAWHDKIAKTYVVRA
jgi:uncharacterized RDD family membrane protein YckC